MAVSQYANRYGEPAPAKKAPAAPAAKKVFKLGPNRRADFGQRVAAAAKAKAPKPMKTAPVMPKPKAPVKGKVTPLPKLVTSPSKSVKPRGSVVPKVAPKPPTGKSLPKPTSGGLVFQNPGNMLDKAKAPAKPMPKGVVNARNMGGNAFAKGGGRGGPMNAPKLRGKAGPKYVTRVKDGTKTAVRSMPEKARKAGPSVGNDKRKGVSAKGGQGKGLDIAKFAQEVSGNFGRGVDAVSRFAGKSASDFGKGVEEVGRMNPMRNYGKRQIGGGLNNPVTKAGGLQKYLESR